MARRSTGVSAFGPLRRVSVFRGKPHQNHLPDAVFALRIVGNPRVESQKRLERGLGLALVFA